MLTKLHTILLICLLLGSTLACSDGKISATSAAQEKAKNQTAQTITDKEIEELFLDSGLGEGDGNLKKLNALPQERVIAVVRKLRDRSKDDPENPRVALKSSYFLWKKRC